MARVGRLAAEVGVVRAGVAAAADAVGGVRAGLAETQELADGSGLMIAADGAVAGPTPPVAGSAAAMQAEVADRLEQVLHAAAALDTDLAALLAATAGTSGTGALDASPARGHHLRRAHDRRSSPPPDGTPADNAGWWSALSPAARQRVVAEHPEWVGNRDGVPAAVRDEANRALLDAHAGRLDADLRAVQVRYDALTAGGPGAVEAVWLAQRNDLLARLDALRRRREVLDAVRIRRNLHDAASCCSTSTGPTRAQRSRSATSTPQNTSPCSPPGSAPPSGMVSVPRRRQRPPCGTGPWSPWAAPVAAASPWPRWPGWATTYRPRWSP